MECLAWQDEPLLTRDEERALGLRVRDHGDREAAEELFRRNLRLALRFSERGRVPHGEDRDDVLQAHLCGLWVAAQRFDPDQGKFSTTACWWMRSYRNKLTHAAGVIDIPRHVRTYRNRARRGEPVTERQHRLIAAWKRIMMCGSNGACDAHADDDTTDHAETHEDLASMRSALSRLSERDRFVLTQRLLEGQTLADVAAPLGVTKQRVQIIQRQALERLRRLMRVETHH